MGKVFSEHQKQVLATCSIPGMLELLDDQLEDCQNNIDFYSKKIENIKEIINKLEV